MPNEYSLLKSIKSLFVRERKPHLVKVIAVVSYERGLGYGSIAKVLRSFGFPAAPSSIRDWVFRCADLPLAPKKKRRKRIAIDEAVVIINQEQWYVWLSVDIKTEEVLAFHVSQHATSIDAAYVIKETLKYCTNKPRIFTDGGEWYPYAIGKYGLHHTISVFGPRSAVERAFSQLAVRLERIGKSYRNTGNILGKLERWVAAMVQLTRLVKNA
jgi:transposase-like protein